MQHKSNSSGRNWMCVNMTYDYESYEWMKTITPKNTLWNCLGSRHNKSISTTWSREHNPSFVKLLTFTCSPIFTKCWTIVRNNEQAAFRHHWDHCLYSTDIYTTVHFCLCCVLTVSLDRRDQTGFFGMSFGKTAQCWGNKEIANTTDYKETKHKLEIIIIKGSSALYVNLLIFYYSDISSEIKQGENACDWLADCWHETQIYTHTRRQTCTILVAPLKCVQTLL